jgi:flagellar hook assembly protein FlgD
MSAEEEHGAIVQVPVNINNVVNGPVQAIKFDVSYNHSILKLDYNNDDALLNGDLTTGANWTFILGTNEQSITLATSDQSEAIQNGLTGSVVLLNFTVIGTAGETTPLELSGIGLSDPSGYNLGTTPAINGTFTVAGGAEPQEPFLIYGYVWYGDDTTPCNNPGVGITNLNTGEEWTATAGTSSNYYQIALTSGSDLNANEVLRFNATDGTKTNITDHTITGVEVNNGGIFGFNLTLGLATDPAPALVTYTISNATISPNGDGIEDDTEIDVEFSEAVAAAIKIENATGVIKTLYTSSSVKDPKPKIWDGTDVGDNIVADGTYQVNITMDDGVNPMVYDITGSITVTTSVVDPSPSLVTYTISNTTISPNGDGLMDDTEIDVKFSESVDAAILIENATGVVRSLYISPDDATDPEPQTWDGTDEGSNIVAYGTYHVNVTMDDGVNPIVYDNTRSIMVANMSVATISIGDGCGIVTIPIEIENGADVGACDIILSYDPAIVNVTGVTGGDMDVTVANLEHAGDGWVRIGTYQTDNPGLSGQITFANVTFEPVGSSGNCSLNLSVRTFKDVTPDGNPMPYVVSNGTYMALLNGDVNGDGVVDMHDAMYLAKHVLGKSGFDVIITEAADVNDDKVIDIADSMHIAKYVLGITGFELR